MNLRLSRLGILVAGVLLLGAGQASANSSPYTFSMLGGITHTTGINSSGQVTGYSSTYDWEQGGPPIMSAVRLTAGVASDLDAAPVPRRSFGHAINNAGDVAGESTIEFPGGPRATVWSGGTRTYLASPNGDPGDSSAWAINNRGQVAGYSTAPDSNKRRATLWNNGVATDLGTLRGGSSSYAVAINDRSHVVGVSTTRDDGFWEEDYRGVMWSNGTVRELGNLDPSAINNVDQVAGSTYSNGGTHAAVWSNGVTTDLGALGEGARSTAFSINNGGEVVGYSQLGGDESDPARWDNRAMLWRGGEMIDLNSLLGAAERDAGWVLLEANAINDSGWIVGNAINLKLGQGGQFQLSVSAVPEPETYAMLLAGLGLLGFVARRRKAA